MQTNRKIKVLQTIRQGLIGGGESHVLGLVGQLDKSLFEPVVLSFTDGPMIRQLDNMGIRNYVIPSLKAFDLRRLKTVKQLLQEEKIDMVHAHGSRAASNLLLPVRSLKIPMLYTIHGWSFHDDQSFLKKNIRIWSEKLITNCMHRNISVSASNQDTGKKYFSRFNSVVINNGIDLQRFDPAGKYADLRTSWGVAPGDTLIGYIARITLQKDPLTMIRAFHEVLQQVQNIRLLVVGDGDLKQAAVDLATDLGIERRIIFENFREDVPDILAATDIYCLPSLWEGLPIGLLEAMAMKNAVIVTAVDGSKEIVRHMQNGWIVEPQQKEQLAKAILHLHHNPTLRAQLQERAAATIQHQYNVCQMTREVERHYREVWESGGRLNLKTI